MPTAAVLGGTALLGAVSSRSASKRATKAQEGAARTASEETRRAVTQARGDLFKLFPAAQQNLQQGFQGALDIFGQTLPAQTQTFQAGNVAAQQQLLSGLPQFQQAILGGNIDFSQLQPTQLQQPDLGFFQQQLPQFIDPFEQERQRQAELEAIRAAAPQVIAQPQLVTPVPRIGRLERNVGSGGQRE